MITLPTLNSKQDQILAIVRDADLTDQQKIEQLENLSVTADDLEQIKTTNNRGILLQATIHCGEEFVQWLLYKCEKLKDSLDGNVFWGTVVKSKKELFQLFIEIKKDLVFAQDKNKKTFLHLLAFRKNVPDFVREFFSEAEINIRDLNSADIDGHYPCHFAATNGNADLIQLLLDNKIDTNVSDKNGWYPIHFAVKHGHLDVFQQLLTNKASVNLLTNTKFHSSPVHIAAYFGRVDILKYLVENLQMPLTIPNDFGKISIHMATEFFSSADIIRNKLYDDVAIAQQAQWDTINYLLTQGVSVQSKIKETEDTPLHIATSKNHFKIIPLLLQHGAKIEELNKDGFSPLRLALAHPDCEILKSFLEKNSKLANLTWGNDNNIPLHVAAYSGNIAAIKLLMPLTEDPRQVIPVGIDGNHPEVVELLLSWRPSLVNQKFNGASPLHLAIERTIIVNEKLTPDQIKSAQEKNIKIIELLIKAGADIHAYDEKGFTPLHRACQVDKTNALQLLLAKGASFGELTKSGYAPIHLAIWENRTEAIKFLFEKGFSINEVTKDGQQSIHVGINANHPEVVELLLKLQPDMVKQKFQGASPLHFAIEKKIIMREKLTFAQIKSAQEKNKKIMELLINAGANIDEYNENGCTPLHAACQTGNINALKLLLAKGASFSELTTTGEYPLHLAVKNGHVECVEYLLLNTDAGLLTEQARFISRSAHSTRWFKEHLFENNFQSTVEHGDIKVIENYLSLAVEQGYIPVVETILRLENEIKAKFTAEKWPYKRLIDFPKFPVTHALAEIIYMEFYKTDVRQKIILILQLLLKHWLNINITNTSGQTVLHKLASFAELKLDKFLEFIDLFISFGANPYIRDNYGATFVEIILKLTVKDVHNNNPISIFSENKVINLFQLLVRRKLPPLFDAESILNDTVSKSNDSTQALEDFLNLMVTFFPQEYVKFLSLPLTITDAKHSQFTKIMSLEKYPILFKYGFLLNWVGTRISFSKQSAYLQIAQRKTADSSKYETIFTMKNFPIIQHKDRPQPQEQLLYIKIFGAIIAFNSLLTHDYFNFSIIQYDFLNLIQTIFFPLLFDSQKADLLKVISEILFAKNPENLRRINTFVPEFFELLKNFLRKNYTALTVLEMIVSAPYYLSNDAFVTGLHQCFLADLKANSSVRKIEIFEFIKQQINTYELSEDLIKTLYSFISILKIEGFPEAWKPKITSVINDILAKKNIESNIAELIKILQDPAISTCISHSEDLILKIKNQCFLFWFKDTVFNRVEVSSSSGKLLHEIYLNLYQIYSGEIPSLLDLCVDKLVWNSQEYNYSEEDMAKLPPLPVSGMDKKLLGKKYKFFADPLEPTANKQKPTPTEASETVTKPIESEPESFGY